MSENRLKRDIVYCKVELSRERDPERRIWLLTRIRDAEAELLNILRAERAEFESANSNLVHAISLALQRKKDNAEK